MQSSNGGSIVDSQIHVWTHDFTQLSQLIYTFIVSYSASKTRAYCSTSTFSSGRICLFDSKAKADPTKLARALAAEAWPFPPKLWDKYLMWISQCDLRPVVALQLLIGCNSVRPRPPQRKHLVVSPEVPYSSPARYKSAQLH